MEKTVQQYWCIQSRHLFIGYRCSQRGKCFPSILGGIALGGFGITENELPQHI